MWAKETVKGDTIRSRHTNELYLVTDTQLVGWGGYVSAIRIRDDSKVLLDGYLKVDIVESPHGQTPTT